MSEESFYLYCALGGGGGLILLLLLEFFGLIDEQVPTRGGRPGFGIPAPRIGDPAFRPFSGTVGGTGDRSLLAYIIPLLAGVALFGLTGTGLSAREYGKTITRLLAVMVGTGTLFLVAWMHRAIHQSRGRTAIPLNQALHQNATVIQTIPESRSGVGVIVVQLDNRAIECRAITAHEELLPGTVVRVQEVIALDTVEVTRAEDAIDAPS